MKRTQIYLDGDQATRLAARARTIGCTRSELIRRAIEAYLEGEGPSATRRLAYREAILAASGAAPDLSPGSRFVDEIRDADAARLDALPRGDA